jgi:hypothetical protein
MRWVGVVVAAALLTAPALAQKPYDPKDFKREVFKTRFEREVQLRAAAIQVAWSAELLCDATTEIEPFVLWSLGTVGRRLSADDLALYAEATGMDEQWRMVWLDEGAPDELHLGDVVTAINGRRLPAGGTRFEMGRCCAALRCFRTTTSRSGTWCTRPVPRPAPASR